MQYPPDYTLPITDVPPGLPLGALNALGQVPPEATGGLSMTAYAAVSLLGAGLGGAATGWLAEGSGKGAITGASFTSGLAAIADSAAFFRSQKNGLAFVFAAVGLGGIVFAIKRAMQQQRR